MSIKNLLCSYNETQIRKTVLKIGIVKHYQANFIMKRLLGDESAANDECEKDELDRLNIAVELGEEVMVDLRKNNGRKLKFEDFWQVKLHQISPFSLIVFLSQGQTTFSK